MKKKILITGGHVTPALALIEELERRSIASVVFVGRKTTFEGDRGLSYEYRVVSEIQIPFIPIVTGRVSRGVTLLSVFSFIKVPIGFIQAFIILLKQKPDLIVSFGGYVSFPVVVVGYFMGIPIIMHEQTLRPGLSNKLTAAFANTICLGWRETQRWFSSHKTVFTGNPVRSGLFQQANKAFAHSSQRVIYVSGGSAGSHVINHAIGNIVREITADYLLIHQVGSSTVTQDFSKLSALQQSLPEKQRSNYIVREYVSVSELAWIYQHATIVIARAGANTVTELAVFGIPAILIPLPWSGEGEQEANARMLEDSGLAKILPQSNLDDGLLFYIRNMIKHLHDHKIHALAAKKLVATDGAARLADVVESLLQRK